MDENYKRIKKYLYRILEKSEGKFGGFINLSILALIFINVFAVILETEEVLINKYEKIFQIIEVISIIIFTIEYLLRIWISTENKHFQKPVIGRIKYIFTFYALIDLFAILPFYLPLLLKMDLRMLRSVRLLRFFRIVKMGRYSKSIRLLSKVLREKKEELGITLFIVFILMIISSSLLYSAEHEVQPDKFPSIPSAMWWGICTLTTVGYGDIYPVTIIGKIFAGIIAILGIGLFALPAGILASGFSENITRKKLEICPKCGEKIWHTSKKEL